MEQIIHDEKNGLDYQLVGDYYLPMQNSDEQNARDESDRATTAAILATMSSGIELYKAVKENDSFRKWIMDMVFNATYIKPDNRPHV